MKIRTPRFIKRWIYEFYERRLMREIRGLPIPKHVGFIMDGNRRFAQSKGHLPWEGHQLGSETVEYLVDWGREIGIKTMTLYAFSTENFQRPQPEVDALMSLFAEKLTAMASDERILGNRVQVRVLGRTELCPQEVLDAIELVESTTAEFENYRLNFCIAYGGRQEIIDAFRALLIKVQAGELAVDAVDEEVLSAHMYTGGNDPDLIIRTGGEARLSNFLLYQSAYSELFFTDVHFPSFRKLDLLRVARAYQMRKRRFGK